MCLFRINHCLGVQGCYIPVKCEGEPLVTNADAANAEQCYEQCASLTECVSFTYYKVRSI